MPLSNTSNTQLAPFAISEMAWQRLCDSFPLHYVSRASGPRGLTYPRPTTASTGSVIAKSEASTQAAETTFQPVIEQVNKSLATYRAHITVSNELLADSGVQAFIADRLSCQIIEKVGTQIIADIATDMIAANRYTATTHWDIGALGTGAAAKIHDHSGHACLSNVSNVYRERGCWVFSADAWRNWGTQERTSLATLGVRRERIRRGRLIGEGTATNDMLMQQNNPNAGGGGGPGGGPGGELEGELSASIPMERRTILRGTTPDHPTWQTAYLGSPIYTSGGLSDTDNAADEAFALFVDLSAYLLFDQPLTVSLDTESKVSKNQTVVHAAYRAVGAFMEPTAAWALVAPS